MTYTETTSEIRVTVKPQFLEDESDPRNGVYAFAYTVRIENFSSRSAQLLKRHWWISSAGVPFDEVEGDGVVGEQPVLQSGEGFVYTSWAVIKDPTGAMVGNYTFRGDGGEEFEVAIPEFDLHYPESIH